MWKRHYIAKTAVFENHRSRTNKRYKETPKNKKRFKNSNVSIEATLTKNKRLSKAKSPCLNLIWIKKAQCLIVLSPTLNIKATQMTFVVHSRQIRPWNMEQSLLQVFADQHMFSDVPTTNNLKIKWSVELLTTSEFKDYRLGGDQSSADDTRCNIDHDRWYIP
jgi:hypothetical protein